MMITGDELEKIIQRIADGSASQFDIALLASEALQYRQAVVELQQERAIANRLLETLKEKNVKIKELRNEPKRLQSENTELKASLNWYIGENDRQAKSWSSEWKQYLKDKQQLQDEINRLQSELSERRDVANKLAQQVIMLDDVLMAAEEEESQTHTTAMWLSADLATLQDALRDIDSIASEAEAWKDFSNGTVPVADMLKIGAIAYKALKAMAETKPPVILAQQWQPVEDETDIDCSCVDPECTSAVQVDGSYLLAFCEGAFVQMDLGEYRICRRVQP